VIDGTDDTTHNESGSDDDDDVRVYAGPMSHGVVLCVGYVIEELNQSSGTVA